MIVAFGVEGRKQTKAVCAALTAVTPSPQNSGCFPMSIFQCNAVVGAVGKRGCSGVNICLLGETSRSCVGVVPTSLQNAWVSWYLAACWLQKGDLANSVM